MDKEIKLTYESLVVVLDERVKTLSDTNTKEHYVILSKILELSQHVNDENAKMNSRVTILEKIDLEHQITWKVLVKIGGAIVTVSGIIFALAKLLLGI